VADMPDLYRLNVQEIVANWGGYLLDIPCVNDQPAINAGVVEIRCFINNSCPFYSVPPTESALSFNDRTLERLEKFFPPNFQRSLTTTRSATEVEGIHFRPRYVFRNNYLYEKNEDGNLEEISSAGSVPGAKETLYEFEQAWTVGESVFDPGTTAEEGETECIKSKWQYRPQKVVDTEMEYRDVKFDYNAIYFQQYENSIEKDENTGDVRLKKGESPKIIFNVVQMPQQLNIVDRFGEGVHWRLRKNTPLYRGEDFFIRFYKTAKASTVNKASPIGKSFSKKFDRYRCLDASLPPESENLTTIGGQIIPINYGLKQFTNLNDKDRAKAYDLHSQSYYVVELGKDSVHENYFIIIPEREKASPLFVHLVPSDDGKFVSNVLSEYRGASGKQLINSEYFTMAVRNHLGEIIIEFSTPDGQFPPWVIQRRDWSSLTYNQTTGQIDFDTIMRNLYVPRGYVTLWGGNIKCGFLFGPLQYASSHIGFVYPPRQVEGFEEINVGFEGDAIEITPPVMGDEENPPTLIDEMTNPFYLPYGSNHHIWFNAEDVNPDTLYKDLIRTGDIIPGTLMFTQDAQFYRNYDEGRRNRNINEYGAFFYGQTIKELPLKSSLSGGIIPNISGFTVFKYRYYNDIRSHHQAFDTVVYMQCGDHLFRKDYYGPEYPDIKTFGEPVWGIDNSGKTTEEREWYLPACKTPILTGMRLIADAGKDPRWPDGTTIRSGIGLTPFDNTSPYFLDVTDHVLSYNESWAASTDDFSSIEHTGTINFLLNTKMAIPVNYTDALHSLQNKTFYIDIWAGYRPCSYSRTIGFYKLFTGLCKGGSISYQYGNINIMTCKVEDYTSVLKDQFFFNSPFFDGMRDVNAIHEVMNLAGFRAEGPFDPGILIKNLSDYSDTNGSQIFFRHIDGRLFKSEPYILPSGYQRLDQPMFKFKDGESYLDAIRRFSFRSSKTFFFDQLGIAHYEDFYELIQLDYLGRLNLTALYKFTTNPEIYPGQLVFNKVEKSYDVESTYNHIKILSGTPDMEVLVRDALNWQSLENPVSEGFIGYLKTYYQQESMFGSEEAVEDAILKYSVFFKPLISYSFETYGLPLRANDMISIDGDVVRVMKVNHELDPSKQSWWMTVECVRFSPVTTVY
jgi:hypothetical protein